MENPYQPPTNSPGYASAFPVWYLLFYKLYGPTWLIGTAMIVASWFNLVSPTIGWVGFGIAGLAAFLSYFLPSLIGIRARDHVVLDSLQLKLRGSEYRDALKRFEKGATLQYDGVTFGIQPGGEVACCVITDAAEVDDAKAIEIDEHAHKVLNSLVCESVEIARALDGRTFKTSILAGRSENFRDLCDVIDGKIDWKHSS